MAPIDVKGSRPQLRYPTDAHLQRPASPRYTPPGTAANKNRAQVKGSSRKIMRQKGSGRARVGSVRSPIRRGGGRAFAKQPKDWSIGLPRKVFEMGIRTALSERWRRSELCVIPDVPRPDTISTRLLLESFYTSPSTSAFSSSLFLLSEIPKEFHLSTRNLPGVQVRLIDDVDVYSLLQHKRIVIDVDSVQYLSDWLGRPQDALVGEELEDVPLPDPSVSMADVDALVSASTSPGAGELGEDKADGDGGVKEHDIVIEQEEAPVQEQRHDVDPLEEQTDRGDRIRDEMHTLGKQQSHTARAEDSPSLKDVL
ncbi:54S ribosomal protein yml6, mitochondrial [Cystobasidiomycetes sp. EMM_F5]